MSNSLQLHTFHESKGARFDGGAAVERVLEYGDVAREYAALTAAAGLFDRSGRGKLRVTGGERTSFVHGMVTNDVNGLKDGQATYAAMITVKGKMVADVRISRRKDELLLDVEPGVAPAAAEFLNHFLISEDAEIADVTEALGLLSFIGPRATECLAAVLGGTRPTLEINELDERTFDGAPLTLVGTRLTSAPGLDVILPAEKLEAFAHAALEKGGPLGLSLVGFSAMEIARVEAGIPRFGQDMTEETIPLEANLESAISYTKGCYVGQEVIARVHYRGHVNRKLTGLIFDDGAPVPAGTALFKTPGDPRPSGTVTSALTSPARPGVLALGYVRRELLVPGTTLVTLEGRAARVTALPFA